MHDQLGIDVTQGLVGGSCMAAIYGQVVVFGGADKTGKVLDKSFIWRPGTGWSEAEGAPDGGRRDASCSVIIGKDGEQFILLAGGIKGDQALDSVYKVTFDGNSGLHFEDAKVKIQPMAGATLAVSRMKPICME